MKGCLGTPAPAPLKSFIIAGSYQEEEPLGQSAEPPHVLVVSARAEGLKWLLHTSPPLTFMGKMAL